jgi:hypothetical protein
MRRVMYWRHAAILSLIAIVLMACAASTTQRREIERLPVGPDLPFEAVGELGLGIPDTTTFGDGRRERMPVYRFYPRENVECYIYTGWRESSISCLKDDGHGP